MSGQDAFYHRANQVIHSFGTIQRFPVDKGFPGIVMCCDTARSSTEADTSSAKHPVKTPLSGRFYFLPINQPHIKKVVD